MTHEEFDDHCWKDVISAEELERYAKNVRGVRVGRNPALLAIDLYNRVYAGGNRPVGDLYKQFPSTCGENAWNAIEPTKRLFAASRKAGIPVIHTTGAAETSTKLHNPKRTWTNPKTNLDDYGFHEDLTPEPGERVIYKERASAFCGTPLQMLLQQQGIDSLIVCGESTSGCVRASVVEGWSLSFHMTVAEECVFDRLMITHKINLFDLHHKYADVMHVDDIIAHLDRLAAVQTSPAVI